MFFEEYQMNALFRNASGSPWVGGVHCIERWRECVPFIASDKKYVVQFITPYFFQGNEFYKEMLFPTTDGGYFIPKASHRLIDISMVNDEGIVSTLEPLSKTELSPFEVAVRNVFMKFMEEYPHINQFFNRFVNEKMNRFISQIIIGKSTEYSDKFCVEIFQNLVEPNYGFQIRQLRLKEVPTICDKKPSLFKKLSLRVGMLFSRLRLHKK
jgi:hypothetical protein